MNLDIGIKKLKQNCVFNVIDKSSKCTNLLYHPNDDRTWDKEKDSGSTLSNEFVGW